MSLISKKSEAFLRNYVNNASPTGFESSGQKIWVEYIKPFVDEWHLDPYGTAYGIINPGRDFKVVIEAHADEISWFVNHITEEGFIHVVRNGGSDYAIAPSKRVNIHTKKGIVRGVFGWPAIHTRSGKSSTVQPSLTNIFIDVGAKKKEDVLKMGVHVGCVITYGSRLETLNDIFYVGRALDNRVGGFCIAEVARLLRKNKKKIPFSLYIVNAVQEEVGLRGAEMIAHRIKPDVAIITDVTHDTNTPLINKKKHGDTRCGNGPSITYAPSVHNILRDLIIETAETKKIPFQRAASSRVTGTDTDAFAYSNSGVPSALISLPLRYMHTTVEMAHKEDIANLIKLMYETILKIKPNHNFQYFS